MREISRGLFVLSVVATLTGIAGYAQGRYDNARVLVNRVSENLRRAEHFTPPNGKEKERYFNAQHHLSQFDKELARGRFDKDKLDQAIDDVKNVVDNNTLSPEHRDALSQDLRDLREMRRNRG